MRTTKTGAATRPASKVQETEIAKHFMALAAQCDPGMHLPFTVTLSMSAAELLGLARLARLRKTTMQGAFADLLAGDEAEALALGDYLANFRG
jgi:hypothetical protein